MSRRSLSPARRFVGREAQLASVDAYLDELDRGRGALLLLTGEPGIGKTRLAEEIVERARSRGARRAWATAWQHEGAPPLWPWVQILRQLGDAEDVLGNSIPESPGASAAARFAQCDAVAQVVRQVSANAPLVVVLDDLHWVDATSIRMLAFVAAATRDAACLLIATCRPDEVAREHLATLAQVATTVAVPPLTDDAAVELLHTAAGVDVSVVAIEAIVARSGGNPLFVWEFGQLMSQSGRLDVAPAAVPHAVVAVIERRLARLAEDAVGILRVAAVVGNPFSADLVAAVGRVSHEAASAGLAAATPTALVIGTDVPGEFMFGHELIREVALEGLGAAPRIELHLRAAQVLGDRMLADSSLHAVVAGHLEHAGPEHAVEVSAQWEHAADRARQVLAYDEAATFLARAAESCGGDNRRRAELLVAEGETRLLAGDLEAARTRFTEAARLARSINAPEVLARAVLGIGAGPVGWEVPIASPEQAALVAHAIAMLPSGETRLRSMLLARQSIAAASPDTMAVAQFRASEALQLAEQVGDAALIAQALAALNDAFSGPNHTMMRRDNADTIIELAAGVGDRVLELLGYRFRIVADLEVGDLAAVDRGVATFERLADALRQPLVSWYVPLFRGMRALVNGDLDAADRYHADVAEFAAATRSPNAQLLAATLLLGIDVARGRRPDPAAFDGIVEADPAEWASYAAGIAFLRVLVGDREGAREMLRLHSDRGFARLGDDAEHLSTLTLFSRAATALSEHEAAEAIYDLLAPHAGLWIVDGIAACCWGPVEEELARLAIVLERPAVALEHLGRARESASRAGATLFIDEIDELYRQLPNASRGADFLATRNVGSPPEPNVFRCDGQFWTMSYRNRTVRMKDAKGLHDIAQLLDRPGHEVHVLDLAGARSTPVGQAHGNAPDLGEVLDARARAEYRRRLSELEDEVADAEQCADLARADRGRVERDFIAAELAAALGLDGRPRRMGNPAERARKAVTGRIRLAIGRVDREHPELARHLANAVHTGIMCVYEPETPTSWMM